MEMEQIPGKVMVMEVSQEELEVELVGLFKMLWVTHRQQIEGALKISARDVDLDVDTAVNTQRDRRRIAAIDAQSDRTFRLNRTNFQGSSVGSNRSTQPKDIGECYVYGSDRKRDFES